MTCSSVPFTDTCYVLSFAIIMLNTSLHNPNVRDKPGVDRFISMNRGINEGGDLPEELLRVCERFCLLSDANYITVVRSKFNIVTVFPESV